jgi:hypothetical protein
LPAPEAPTQRSGASAVGGPDIERLQRTILNAAIVGDDPTAVSCPHGCPQRTQQADVGRLRPGDIGRLRPGESLVPRTCPHVATALIWLRHRDLVTIDTRGIRPTRQARTAA